MSVSSQLFFYFFITCLFDILIDLVEDFVGIDISIFERFFDVGTASLTGTATHAHHSGHTHTHALAVDDLLDDDAVDIDLIHELLGDLLLLEEPLLVHRKLRCRFDVQRLLFGGDRLELRFALLVRFLCFQFFVYFFRFFIIQFLVRFDHLFFFDFVRLDTHIEVEVEDHVHEPLRAFEVVFDDIEDFELVFDVLACERMVEIDAGTAGEDGFEIPLLAFDLDLCAGIPVVFGDLVRADSPYLVRIVFAERLRRWDCHTPAGTDLLSDDFLFDWFDDVTFSENDDARLERTLVRDAFLLCYLLISRIDQHSLSSLFVYRAGSVSDTNKIVFLESFLGLLTRFRFYFRSGICFYFCSGVCFYFRSGVCFYFCLFISVFSRRFLWFATHTQYVFRYTLNRHVSPDRMCIAVMHENTSGFGALGLSTGMYEVEVKVRADHDKIRSRLNELGNSNESNELDEFLELDELYTTPTQIVQQTDTYYDAPHRDFEETDEALRIREETEGEKANEEETDEEEPTIQLTYKGPLVDDDSKTREESETIVSNRETMDAILESLGFSPAAIVEKEREHYALGEYTVTLDTVSHLGEFVEVERVSDDTEIETVREDAFSILRELGLDPDDQIRTSYLGLLIKNDQ
jgi:adenylate cyclase class 2